MDAFLVMAERRTIRGLGESAVGAGAGANQWQRAAEGCVIPRNTCINCHAIKGTSAAARVGPDLTHLASRRKIGAGVVENTPANLCAAG